MAKPTLIDTDILIDAARGIADAVACLNNIKSNSGLATSVVTQMELIVGCRNKVELKKVEKFLKQFQVIKISEPVSDKAVELLQTYRLGHGLLIADAFIGGTAMVLDWPLITKNQRDYKFIAGLNLLPYP
jgi:predicted nucleic acid-binding protein